MRRFTLVALVALVACSRDLGEPGTRFFEPMLPATALTAIPDVRLVAAPGGAAMVAVGQAELRWASVDPDGRLGVESRAPLPAHELGPWVGLAPQAGSGDRAVVVWGQPAPADGHMQIFASVLGGDAASSSPEVLLDVPTSTDAGRLRVDAATGRAGEGTAVVMSFEDQPAAPLLVRVVKPGTPSSRVEIADRIPRPWRCLSLVPSHTAFAVMVVGVDRDAAGKTPVVLYELNDTGNVVLIHQLALTIERPACPVVAAVARGYLLAMQTDEGTFLADYDVTGRTAPTELVLGAVRFGGPSQQPPAIGVARLGLLGAILFGRPQGPEVWLFDTQGKIQGDALRLPVTGRATGFSALAVDQSIWVTYLDDAAARRFVRIEAKRPSADAGSLPRE